MYAEKVGTVSSCHQFDKNAVMHCNSYTLCEVDKDKTRNGSRNGFAQKAGFYRSPVMGSSAFDFYPLPVQVFFENVRVYVIPGQTPMERSNQTSVNSSASLTARGFRRFFPEKNTVPTFFDHFNGFAGRFFPVGRLS